LEPTPAEYVERLVAIFAEVRRVLTAGGTLWLNLGDSYAQGSKGNSGAIRPGDKQGTNIGSLATRRGSGLGPNRTGGTKGFCKPKDLVGIPWRVAFALQDDGWWLRSDVIWAKPNPMPESVTDRPTKAHEYVFLFAKNERYYFGQDDLREPAAWERWGDQTTPKYNGTDTGAGWIKPRTKAELTPARRKPLIPEQTKAGVGTQGFGSETFGHWADERGRNVRTVWTIATESYPEAHFAVFPQELARRMILGGCPSGGTVLDPFGGSGTTALMARKLHRRAVLIELNEDYCKLAADRLSQQSLFADVASNQEREPS
jgi:DNA modification methylase